MKPGELEIDATAPTPLDSVIAAMGADNFIGLIAKGMRLYPGENYPNERWKNTAITVLRPCIEAAYLRGVHGLAELYAAIRFDYLIDLLEDASAPEHLKKQAMAAALLLPGFDPAQGKSQTEQVTGYHWALEFVFSFVMDKLHVSGGPFAADIAAGTADWDKINEYHFKSQQAPIDAEVGPHLRA